MDFLEKFSSYIKYAAAHNGAIIIKEPLDIRYLEEWLSEAARKYCIKTGIFTNEFKTAIKREYQLGDEAIEDTPPAYIYRKMLAAIKGRYNDPEYGENILKLFIYRPKEFIDKSNNIPKDLEEFENCMLEDDDTKSWWLSDGVQKHTENIRLLGRELQDIKNIFLDLL